MQTANQNDVVQPSAPPPNKTLTQRVEEYLDLIVEADGEFTDEVELALGSIEEKAESYKRVRSMLKARADWFRNEAAKYTRWAKAVETHDDKLVQWMADAMDAADLSEIKTRIGKVYFKVSPKVEIVEEAKWLESAPEEFVKVERSAKKAALLAVYRDAVKKHSGPEVSEREAHELALAELPKGAQVVLSRSLVL
jgi:hypothetical protein